MDVTNLGGNSIVGKDVKPTVQCQKWNLVHLKEALNMLNENHSMCCFPFPGGMFQGKRVMIHFCLVTLISLDEFVQLQAQVHPSNTKYICSSVMAPHRLILFVMRSMFSGTWR